MKRILPVLISPGLLFGLAVLFPLPLLGAEQSAPPIAQATPEAQPAIPATSTSDSFDAMDANRDYLSDKIANFASNVDRFFGGDRHYQESNESVVQLSLARAMGYGGDPKFNLAAKVNLKLPITEGKFHLLLETDPENNAMVEPAVTPIQGRAVLHDKVVVPSSFALAARYATAQEKIWNFSTDWGLKFPLPVEPFMRARGSYAIPLGQWRLKAAESVYWFNSLGTGETSRLDLERVISAPFLFRSSSTATWLNNKQNFDLRQDLSLYQTLNDRTVLLYQASAIGVSNPRLQASDYVLLMNYRYRMHKEWLYFEISPQLHFPREKQFKTSAALSVRLEVQFDESR